MINHDLRCIYVHIPKTAGNSVNRVFGIGWSDHKDLAKHAAEVSPEVFERYLKFAIVRNPWDRLFSDYNYQLKKSRPAASKLFLHDRSGLVRGFSDWVRATLADPHRYSPRDWGGDVSPGLHRWSPQVDWISVDGRNRLDCLLRMESLQADFSRLCSRLGLPPVRLPRRNRRLHWHYSWYYDDDTREFVSAYYARDIAAFGYHFEPSPLRSAWLRLQALTGTGAPELREPAPLLPPSWPT